MLLTPRSLFVHIPKTGGMWVIDALVKTGTPCYMGAFHHTPPGEILPVVPDRYSFTFVRQPVTWWRSLWSHSAATDWPSYGEPFQPVIGCGLGDSYESFMTRVLNDCPGQYSRIVEHYTEGIRHVGRFEHLESDLAEILARAGEPPLPAGLVPVNVGQYTDLAVSTPEIDREILRTEDQVVSMFYGG